MLLQASREVMVANLQLYQVITDKMAQASDKVTIECEYEVISTDLEWQ